MKDKTKRQIILLTSITLTCKVIGFLKNIVLAKYWGTGNVVDAYVMVFAIGNVVFGWIGAFTGNFTPEYKKVSYKYGKEKANEFTNNLKNWLILITFIFVFLFEVFAKTIVSVVAPGYEGEVYELTVLFWRIYSVSFFALIMYRLYKEFINCNGKCVQALLPDLLMSSLCIVSIVVSAYSKKEFLIWGYIVAIVLEALCESIVAHKTGLNYKFILKFDDSIKAVLIAVLPMFLSDTLVDINTFVDKFFASNLQSGTISILDYANNVKNIAYETGIVAVTTIMYPKISEYWAQKNLEEFKGCIQRYIRIMCLLFIPISFGFFAAGKYLIGLIYQRGAFTEEATGITYGVLIMYSVGLTAIVLRLILNKVFCSMQQTGYVLITSVINVLVNIGMNCLLVKKWGIYGLAFSTSIAAIVALIVGLVFLDKYINMKFGNTFWAVFRMLFASLIMFGTIMLARVLFIDSISFGQMTFFVQLLICFVLGVAVYALVALLLRIEEMQDIVKYVKAKIKR